jgi:hypothetical protein
MKRDRDMQRRRDGFRSRILARQLADEVLRTVSGGCTRIYPNDGPPRSDFLEL